MCLLKVENVARTYISRGGKGHKKRQVRAVRGVSFELDEGSCLGIIGESGCGKSTLGRLLSGLENPSDGRVIFKGEEIRAARKKIWWRREIQIVYQNSVDALNPRMTAAKILAEPLYNFYRLTGDALHQRQVELMEIVGLLPGDLHKIPAQFSGGQLQRICIARALAANPRLIVLDEPLSSLDVSVQAQILNLLGDIKRELGVAYILISHDIEAVYYLADSLAIMYSGTVVEQIEDIKIYKSLTHPYTKRLFSAPTDNAVEAESISEHLETEHGCVYATRCKEAEEQCRHAANPLHACGEGHLISCLHY